ncbi:MAG: hypothetical protein QNJ45_17745 [Ardenticatenaceae bacterium]|nr:hypothetical protein [Ardenticatenaceae bacterium]
MDEAVFIDRYERWMAHINRPAADLFSSADAPLIENEPFRGIVALGHEAVPFIMKRLLCDEEGHFLIHALAEITGRQFSDEEYEAAELLFGEPLGNQAIAAMWLGWWWKDQREADGMV